jgi:hypothetical protein
VWAFWKREIFLARVGIRNPDHPACGLISILDYIIPVSLIAGTNNTEYTQKMLRFQKLTTNLFLTLNGHNVHRQQRQMSKFLMRYQQFASYAYRGASFQNGVAVSMSSELLVAHEKLGHLPLLTVYVVPV